MTNDPAAVLNAGRDRFWASHMRLGFIVLTVESAAVMVYLRATPSGPFRPQIWAAATVCAAAGATFAVLSSGLARKGWRMAFTLAWTLVAGIAAAISAHLDGGVDSPLAVLIWLTVFYAAIALPPAWTAFCSAGAVAETLALAVADDHVDLAIGALTVIAAAVVGAIMLAISSSVNREVLETRQSALMDELAQLASVDGLSGCLNRRAFHERLNEEVHRAVRYGTPLSLLVADIDNFKAVNDANGHPYGDSVLARVGRCALEDSRQGDVAGRVGGDEFAVLLPNAPTASAVRRAERLRACTDRADGACVTLSVGVATLRADDPTRARLLRDADAALYTVKRNGRDGIAVAGRRPAPFAPNSG